VYFEGGGACWNQETCRKGSTWYKDAAMNNAGDYFNFFSQGIFNMAQPENPFAAYSMVFVPSCTGDADIGSRISDYGDGVEIYHYGFVNMRAVLDLLDQWPEQPDSLFVAGCSSGSVGSVIATPYLIERYPDVPLVQFGDSLGTIYNLPLDLDALWGAGASAADWILPQGTHFDLGSYTIALMQHYPDYQFAQYNSQFDAIQQQFFGPRSLVELLINRTVEQMSAAAPNFRSVVAGGDQHCILQYDDLYTYRVQNVRLVDWLRDLSLGLPVESLHCSDCEEADTISD
jgi:hypothetical protein